MYAIRSYYDDLRSVGRRFLGLFGAEIDLSARRAGHRVDSLNNKGCFQLGGLALVYRRIKYALYIARLNAGEGLFRNNFV